MRQSHRAIASVLWIATAFVSGVLAIYCLIVAGAQVEYHGKRYGKPSADAFTTATACGESQATYPRNYRFCRLAAQRAFDDYFEADKRRDDLLEIARRWCDTGFRLNPYDRELNILRLGLLDIEDRSLALEFWEEYVDWYYWNTYNFSKRFRCTYH